MARNQRSEEFQMIRCYAGNESHAPGLLTSRTWRDREMMTRNVPRPLRFRDSHCATVTRVYTPPSSVVLPSARFVTGLETNKNRHVKDSHKKINIMTELTWTSRTGKRAWSDKTNRTMVVRARGLTGFPEDSRTISNEERRRGLHLNCKHVFCLSLCALLHTHTHKSDF